MKISLVTEAYNLEEGQSEAAFLQALDAIEAVTAGRTDVEVIVLDPSSEGAHVSLVRAAKPGFRVLSLPDHSYDEQKNRAAEQARGDIVVFLDGDCRPLHGDWLEAITAQFSTSDVQAVGGLTVYDDFSVTGKAMTVLDFGYLFAPRYAALGCYASNNVAFRRERYLSLPVPEESGLRCACYKHAQLLCRAGTPVIFEPLAAVLHELPDLRKERLRRGYDLVAACWADPLLPETDLLENTPDCAARILLLNSELDAERLALAPAAASIAASERDAVWQEMRRLRAVDLEGVSQALSVGERDGLTAQAQQARIQSAA